MSPDPIIHEIDVQIAITLASIGYLGEFRTIAQHIPTSDEETRRATPRFDIKWRRRTSSSGAR